MGHPENDREVIRQSPYTTTYIDFLLELSTPKAWRWWVTGPLLRFILWQWVIGPPRPSARALLAINRFRPISDPLALRGTPWCWSLKSVSALADCWLPLLLCLSMILKLFQCCTIVGSPYCPILSIFRQLDVLFCLLYKYRLFFTVDVLCSLSEAIRYSGFRNITILKLLSP